MTAPKCLGLICREPKYCADMGECCRLVGQEDSEATAAPVMSITDELVAELEAAASYCVTEVIRSHPWSEQEFDLLRADERYVRAASPEFVLALLAERAELIKDRERLDWLIADSAIVHAGTRSKCRGAVTETIFWVAWPELEEMQNECFATPREAVDAARADNP